jgi:hypothetical protein
MKIIQYTCKYIYIEINNLHILKQAVIYDSNKELLLLGLHCQHVFKFTSLNNSNEFEFVFCCLTPLSAISQLYHGLIAQIVINPTSMRRRPYKPITNTAWVHARFCKLQKRVHSIRNHR